MGEFPINIKLNSVEVNQDIEYKTGISYEFCLSITE